MSLIQEVEKMLRDAIAMGDPENAHIAADIALVYLLRQLELNRLADLYEKVPKWYA